MVFEDAIDSFDVPETEPPVEAAQEEPEVGNPVEITQEEPQGNRVRPIRTTAGIRPQRYSPS